MIDFHTHILPGMDDGSKDLEQTYLMLDEMKKKGIDVVVATPHFDMESESIESFISRRDEAFSKLKLDESYPEIILGAEVLYTGDYLYNAEGIEKLCMGNTRFMLIEGQIERWEVGFRDCLLKLILEKGIIPIIAHIERYIDIGKNKQILETLMDQGAVLQMNADYFMYRRTRRKALKLFKTGFVHLLGSDCHNMENRPPNLNDAVEVLREYIGEDAIWHLEAVGLGVLRRQF